MQSQSSSPGIVGNNLGQGPFNQYNNCVLSPADHHRELSEAASKLYEHVAATAIHNSADQGADAPRCDPQTREAVQQDILSHLSHPGKQGGHIWLTGPAGTGKTAIVGSVCDKLEEEGRLAATFYFSSHKNSRNRKSKKDFVTTLAHQLQQHHALNEHISTSMLSAIQRQREIFDMNLEKQADTLILRPFQSAKTLHITPPLIVAVDGIDECEEDHDTDHDQSRQHGQIEVLRILLTLANDPSFPCRIIVASRPETWIRIFFRPFLGDEGAVHFKEMFLGKDYRADADIQLYYQSHFARISRRCEYNTSEWPEKEDLWQLVENASGQFIYAATVIRFVDSILPLPKDQLKLVLQVNFSVAGSNPLNTLDELYTTIVKRTSPCPNITIIWLQGVRIVKQIEARVGGLPMVLRDFIDTFFESSESQAKTVLALPSLISPVYDFYHKSFVDYLEDTARSGIAFPDVDRSKVDQWLAKRISNVLQCGGPEVRISSYERADLFRSAFRKVWLRRMFERRHPLVSQDTLAKSSPEIWLSPPSDDPSWLELEQLEFGLFVYTFVHVECRFYSRCGAGCRRWRKVIKENPEYRSELIARWDSFDILLDRLCIKRVYCSWV